MVSHAELFFGLCEAVSVKQIRFITSCGNLSMSGNPLTNLFTEAVVRERAQRKKRTKNLGRNICCQIVAECFADLMR